MYDIRATDVQSDDTKLPVSDVIYRDSPFQVQTTAVRQTGGKVIEVSRIIGETTVVAMGFEAADPSF